MSTSSHTISHFCSSASSPCVTCTSPHIFPTQQLWTRQWGLQWPAWDLRWFCRLCLWKLMALSKCDPRWLLYELREGQTACCYPEGCAVLWVKSLCRTGVIKRPEQGLHCSLVQGTFCWVCCPPSCHLFLTGPSLFPPRETLDFPRSWLLPVIRDHVRETRLGFFTAYFLPLATTLKTKGMGLTAVLEPQLEGG